MKRIVFSTHLAIAGCVPPRRATTTAVPVRPVAFVLGLLLCLAGAFTCATAPAGDRGEFPSRADLLVIGGLALVVLGVAGREARGRQLLGRRTPSPSAPSSPPPPANPAPPPHDDAP